MWNSCLPGLANTGSWHQTTVRAWGVQDVTTHAPLRSLWTTARSVCHVRGLGDGDTPTSPTKDTRLEAVACTPLEAVACTRGSHRQDSILPHGVLDKS